ncbi:MAG: hypothetical protein JXA03_01130 [Bacteroidales bacterium]|nr:hypothetical protein [Bacteroidales bacterium]
MKLYLKIKITLLSACLFLLMAPQEADAQEVTHNFRYFDKTTYDHYIRGSYDSVIVTGNQALNAGYDYFYLRLRMGLAYYFSENFRLSSWHLLKARKFNPDDTLAFRYLYLSYLFSKQEAEADALIATSPSKQLAFMKGQKKSLFRQIYAETGYIFSDADIEIKGGKKHAPDTAYREWDLNGDRLFFSAGFQIKPSPFVTSFADYTYVTSQKQRIIEAPGFIKSGYDTIPYNGWYYVDTVYRKALNIFRDDYRLEQHQLYANSVIRVSNSWKIIPAVHFIFLSYETIYPVFEPAFAQSYDTVPTIGEYSVIKMSSNETDMVVSFGVVKPVKRTDVGLRASYSRLNKAKQYQMEGSLTWYPSGNLNTYTHSQIWVQKQNHNTYLLVQQSAGHRISSGIWAEANIQVGEMRNYNESNGFVVYNTGDQIKMKTGFNLIFLPGAKTEWTFRFNYYKLTGSSRKFTDINNFSADSFDYNNYSITGGLIWKL